MAAQIHRSKFSEKTTIAVLGKYKGANINLDTLHKQINKSLELIEEKILASPEDESLKTLLLQMMEIHQRDKCVANVQGWEYVEGHRSLKTQTIHKDIKNNADWAVSIVKGGTKVRVHLTKEARAAVQKALEDSGEWTEITVY